MLCSHFTRSTPDRTITPATPTGHEAEQSGINGSLRCHSFYAGSSKPQVTSLSARGLAGPHIMSSSTEAALSAASVTTLRTHSTPQPVCSTSPAGTSGQLYVPDVQATHIRAPAISAEFALVPMGRKLLDVPTFISIRPTTPLPTGATQTLHYPAEVASFTISPSPAADTQRERHTHRTEPPAAAATRPLAHASKAERRRLNTRPVTKRLLSARKHVPIIPAAVAGPPAARMTAEELKLSRKYYDKLRERSYYRRLHALLMYGKSRGVAAKSAPRAAAATKQAASCLAAPASALKMSRKVNRESCALYPLRLR